MGKGKTVRGIQLESLFKYQNANVAFTVLGAFYLVFPWFTSGVFDTATAMFGMMFWSIGILRAKASASVLGGLMVAFLGICYFFGTIAFIDMNILWALTIVLFVAFLIFELGYVKLGPATTSAKSFSIVPLSLLTFSLLLAFVGKNPVLTIDFSDLLVAVNYFAIMLFALFSMLDFAGWRVMGNATDKWVMVFAIVALISAVLGVYQGTVLQWS